MFYLALLTCLLQALNLVQSLPNHSLHEHLHHLLNRQAKSPDDLTTLGAQVIPTPLHEPKNIGSVNPALETKGITSVVPFVTKVPIASFPQRANSYAQAPLAPQVAQPTPQAVVSGIFDNPIDTARPPNTIGTKNDHPQPRTGIVSPNTSSIKASIPNVDLFFQVGQTSPIGTNKFYASFFLGAQTAPVWTHPYSLQWSKGTGNAKSWGISIAHTTPEERVGHNILFTPLHSIACEDFWAFPSLCGVELPRKPSLNSSKVRLLTISQIFGPNAAADPVQYYINPIGVQSLIFSAKELGS